MQLPKYKIAHYGLHFWEEPIISGQHGSGTIFFSGCNLHCAYCQNYAISQQRRGTVITEDEFISICRYLQGQGAHNINLVTPTHYIKCLQTTLPKVKQEISIPICYNTSSYENVDDLSRLTSLVDVYLADIRYFSDELAQKYSGAKEYFKIATKSIEQMLVQQQINVIDDNGIMNKGVVIRLLVLPSHKQDTKKIIDYLADYNKNLTISIMAQYFPTYNASKFPEINRKITRREYDSVCDYALQKGFINGFFQQLSSARQEYVPQFNMIDGKPTNNPLHLGKK